MKIFGLLSCLVFLTTFAFADEKDHGFNEHKQQMLKEMGSQISALQTAKNCIAAASDHEAIKRCHEALEVARKQHKAEELNARIHQLEEEKAKLDKSN